MTPVLLTWLVISAYLSLLPVAHLSDTPRRWLVIIRDSARIQDETTESSACSLTLSQTTNFRLFQTERVCRRQYQIVKMAECSLKWVENTVGKGEIARYEQFLLFPQCFQDLYCRHIKTRACLGKG